MAQILWSQEGIGARYKPTLDRLHRELFSESGVKPRVLSPYGGDRTDAEQYHLIKIGLTGVPPDRTDHSVRKNGGRAVDHDNWQAIVLGIVRRRRLTYSAALARYQAICAKWGWKNQTIDGFPFPSENWHHANHLSLARLAALTVKVIVTPTPKPPKGAEDMNVFITDGKRFAETVKGTGWFVEYANAADYNSAAKAVGIGGDRVTVAVFDKYRDQAQRIRTGTA